MPDSFQRLMERKLCHEMKGESGIKERDALE